MSVKVKVCEQCGQRKKIGGTKKRCKTCRSGLTAKERSLQPACGDPSQRRCVWCMNLVDSCNCNEEKFL